MLSKMSKAMIVTASALVLASLLLSGCDSRTTTSAASSAPALAPEYRRPADTPVPDLADQGPRDKYGKLCSEGCEGASPAMCRSLKISRGCPLN